MKMKICNFLVSILNSSKGAIPTTRLGGKLSGEFVKTKNDVVKTVLLP